MQYIKRWTIVVLMLVTVLLVTACSEPQETVSEEAPAQLEAIPGSDFNLVTLTERAAERLDIQSEPVREETIDDSTRLVVPYAAIIYGLNGETWAYIRNPGASSLAFVRVAIAVERIEGDLAILSDGPEVGSEVITIGAAELYGVDTGVGK